MKRTILAAISGAVLACALILSCSDSPSGADAQETCDCPAAEPPLTGRIVRVTQTVALPAQGDAFIAANCAAGGVLVGGGCATEVASSQIPLWRATPDEGGAEVFSCGWTNSTTDANTGIATAICLMPPASN